MRLQRDIWTDKRTGWLSYNPLKLCLLAQKICSPKSLFARAKTLFAHPKLCLLAQNFARGIKKVFLPKCLYYLLPSLSFFKSKSTFMWCLWYLGMLTPRLKWTDKYVTLSNSPRKTGFSWSIITRNIQFKSLTHQSCYVCRNSLSKNKYCYIKEDFLEHCFSI